MSLKVGRLSAWRWRDESSFHEWVGRVPEGREPCCFWFWVEQIVGAVGMWKSRRWRFPRAVDDGGKLDVELGLPVRRDESFPPTSTARHFHSAPRFSSAAPGARQERQLGLLHVLCGVGVGVALSFCSQALLGDPFLEVRLPAG